MKVPNEHDLIIDGKLMGYKDPMWELDKEQPWHRWAAFAFALGASIKDVAIKLGRSEPAVQNLMRQKWFQEEVTAMMAEYGAKDIMAMLRAEGFNSLTTLVELRDNPRAPAAVRCNCARDILDRTLGKPVQRVETTMPAASNDPVAEVERLEQEVHHLRRFSTSGSAVMAEAQTDYGNGEGPASTAGASEDAVQRPESGPDYASGEAERANGLLQ